MWYPGTEKYSQTSSSRFRYDILSRRSIHSQVQVQVWYPGTAKYALTAGAGVILSRQRFCHRETSCVSRRLEAATRGHNSSPPRDTTPHTTRPITRGRQGTRLGDWRHTIDPTHGQTHDPHTADPRMTHALDPRRPDQWRCTHEQRFTRIPRHSFSGTFCHSFSGTFCHSLCHLHWLLAPFLTLTRGFYCLYSLIFMKVFVEFLFLFYQSRRFKKNVLSQISPVIYLKKNNIWLLSKTVQSRGIKRCQSISHVNI